ncbi:MAG: hypothetical protein EOM20_21125, partial [Spartobacteria bacterium]|nr:hypothetical protein [Spartobacteria bacterium]
ALETGRFSNSVISLENPADPNYSNAVACLFDATTYQPSMYALGVYAPHALGANGAYTLSISGIEGTNGAVITSNTTALLSMAATEVTLAAGAQEHEISPYIYGVNLAPDEAYLSGAGFTVNRRSGNDNSCYNWKLEVSNKAEDHFYQNFRWDPVFATNAMEETALLNALAGAAMLWTMPMQEWVAADTSSYSFSVAKYGTQQYSLGDMGNGYLTNGLTRITNNNPRDAYVPAAASPSPGDDPDTVYMDEWLQRLQSAFGEKTTDLFPFVSLDNEIDIWYDVHHDTWPTEMSYDVLLDKFIRYASMIRSNMPAMKIHGPVSTSWWFYWNSDAGSADKTAHGEVDFLEWFLRELKDYEDTVGVRLLDTLDIHYYPANPLIFNSNIDADTRAVRIAEVDSFWNTNFVDLWEGISNNPWATTQPDYDKPYIIPRFQALIESNYPGTRLCISEWQMGADHDISAGIAVADALGVFAREDLYMACYWRYGSDMPTDSAAYNAFKLYGNYDSEGRRFRPVYIQSTSAQPDLLGAYASRGRAGDSVT